MHMSTLLLNISNLRFDDYTASITEHISAFKTKYSLFRKNTSNATASTNLLATGIKNFNHANVWKAIMLLSTVRCEPAIGSILWLASN